MGIKKTITKKKNLQTKKKISKNINNNSIKINQSKTIEKTQIKQPFFKSIFLDLIHFNKKEILFLLLCLALPIIILTILFNLNISENILSVITQIIGIAGPIYIIGILIGYKQITKCSEKELFNIGLKYIIILLLFLHFLSSIEYFQPNYPSSVISVFIITDILSLLKDVVLFTFLLYGLNYLIHTNNRNFKEISILFGLGIALESALLLLKVGMFNTVFQIISIDLPFNIMDIFVWSNLLAIIINGITTIIFYYSFVKICEELKQKNIELKFFTLIGIFFATIYLLNNAVWEIYTITGLEQSSQLIRDSILNIGLETVYMFLTWFAIGLIFKWYNDWKIKKEISK